MSAALKKLLAAVSTGDIAEVKARICDGNVNYCDPEEGSLLAWAVTLNHFDVAELLLRHGALVHVADRNGFSPIHRAAWKSAPQICQLLLDNGADVNTVHPKSRRTPLILAAIRGDVEIVRLLIHCGASVDTQDGAGMSAIDHAARQGRRDVVAFLMNAGADCNNAREHADAGSDAATTLPQREAFEAITKMLCEVWAKQSIVTVL